MADTELYRLQKFLSRAGVTSRRKAEAWIREGRVSVDGEVVTEQGVKIDPEKARVAVDGTPVNWRPERIYIALNKPTGYITTLDDPHDRPIVVDLLPDDVPRVFPVGRLDWDSEGLLILTNDGDLAHLLTHPSHEVPRVYAVKVKGLLENDLDAFNRLRKGVEIDGDVVTPDALEVTGDTGKHTWIQMELHSGKNRVVRRMCEAVGHRVLRLKRVRFGAITLEGIGTSAFRDLSADEVKALYESAGANPDDAPPVRHQVGPRPRTKDDARKTRSGNPEDGQSSGARGSGGRKHRGKTGGRNQERGGKSKRRGKRGGKSRDRRRKQRGKRSGKSRDRRRKQRKRGGKSRGQRRKQRGKRGGNGSSARGGEGASSDD